MLSDEIRKKYEALRGQMTAESFEEALKKSDDLAQAMIDAINEVIPPGMKEEELIETLSPEMAQLYDDALEVARTAQKRHNKDSGLGLEPVEIKVDTYRTNGLAEKLASDEGMKEGKGVSPGGEKQIQNLANSAVDETIKRNAEFQDKSGIEVTVTRHYDGVGLKTGTCRWCEDREGREIPYQDALARGMFQRHPGCGCSITYKSGKKKYHQADWTRNSWVDTDDELAMRKAYGL